MILEFLILVFNVNVPFHFLASYLPGVKQVVMQHIGELRASEHQIIETMCSNITIPSLDMTRLSVVVTLTDILLTRQIFLKLANRQTKIVEQIHDA